MFIEIRGITKHFGEGENRIGMLEQAITKLKKENAELKMQNEKLQKLLNKKNLNVLKS